MTEVMGDWIIPEEPNAIFLIPVKDISLNSSILGNHPSKQAILNFLDNKGKEDYYHALQRRKRDAKDGSGSVDGYKVIAEDWPGHQIAWENISEKKVYSFFWEDKFNNKYVPFFDTFDDLYNYVKTEGINIYPIYVYVERDGELVLMEGRHRWMCAYLQDMEKIPCIIRARKNSYEPEFARKIQEIKDLRFIPSN